MKINVFTLIVILKRSDTKGNLFGLTRQKFVVSENNFSDEGKWTETISSSDDFVDLIVKIQISQDEERPFLR